MRKSLIKTQLNNKTNTSDVRSVMVKKDKKEIDDTISLPNKLNSSHKNLNTNQIVNMLSIKNNQKREIPKKEPVKSIKREIPKKEPVKPIKKEIPKKEPNKSEILKKDLTKSIKEPNKSEIPKKDLTKPLKEPIKSEEIIKSNINKIEEKKEETFNIKAIDNNLIETNIKNIIQNKINNDRNDDIIINQFENISLTKPPHNKAYYNAEQVKLSLLDDEQNIVSSTIIEPKKIITKDINTIDCIISNNLKSNNIILNNGTITSIPTSDNDIVNKRYIDNEINKLTQIINTIKKDLDNNYVNINKTINNITILNNNLNICIESINKLNKKIKDIEQNS